MADGYVPAASPRLSDADVELLTGPNPAVVTTLRSDGTPHSTLLWIDWDGEQVVVNTAIGRIKERHLRRDPRISVCVHPADDMYRYVVLEGEVELTTDQAEGHADLLWHRYRGIGFQPTPGERRVLARFRPQRIYSYAQTTPGRDPGRSG